MDDFQSGGVVRFPSAAMFTVLLHVYSMAANHRLSGLACRQAQAAACQLDSRNTPGPGKHHKLWQGH